MKPKISFYKIKYEKDNLTLYTLNTSRWSFIDSYPDKASLIAVLPSMIMDSNRIIKTALIIQALPKNRSHLFEGGK